MLREMLLPACTDSLLPHAVHRALGASTAGCSTEHIGQLVIRFELILASCAATLWRKGIDQLLLLRSYQNVP